MNVDLLYGHKRVKLDVAGDGRFFPMLEPRRTNMDTVWLALAVPIDSPRLCDLIHVG
jgi:hypothetical protein